MNITRLIEKLMILTEYDFKFAVQLTEQFVSVGFVTLRLYCIYRKFNWYGCVLIYH